MDNLKERIEQFDANFSQQSEGQKIHRMLLMLNNRDPKAREIYNEAIKKGL